MNQIDILCCRLSKELSDMRCPDCGAFHHVNVSHLVGETSLSANFPTLSVGIDPAAADCNRFASNVLAIVRQARAHLIRRNGLG